MYECYSKLIFSNIFLKTILSRINWHTIIDYRAIKRYYSWTKTFFALFHYFHKLSLKSFKILWKILYFSVSNIKIISFTNFSSIRLLDFSLEFHSFTSKFYNYLLEAVILFIPYFVIGSLISLWFDLDILIRLLFVSLFMIFSPLFRKMC